MLDPFQEIAAQHGEFREPEVIDRVLGVTQAEPGEMAYRRVLRKIK